MEYYYIAKAILDPDNPKIYTPLVGVFELSKNPPLYLSIKLDKATAELKIEFTGPKKFRTLYSQKEIKANYILNNMCFAKYIEIPIFKVVLLLEAKDYNVDEELDPDVRLKSIERKLKTIKEENLKPFEEAANDLKKLEREVEALLFLERLSAKEFKVLVKRVLLPRISDKRFEDLLKLHKETD